MNIPKKSHRHNDFTTNIIKLSPSLSHQHNVVTNITVTLKIRKAVLSQILREGKMDTESNIWDCIEYLEAEGYLIRPVNSLRTICKSTSFDKNKKVSCFFSMKTLPDSSMGKHRDDDHREDAPHEPFGDSDKRC